MEYDRIDIVACPHCGAYVQRPEVERMSTHGLSIWSDGKMEGPWFAYLPALHGCLGCDAPFWVGSARKVGEMIDTTGCPVPVRGMQERAAPARLPDAEVCLRALESGMGDILLKEKYLRQMMWWALNDPQRTGAATEVAPQHLALFRDNLKRLRDVTLGDLASMLFQKACIARDLGEWDEARRLLEETAAGTVGGAARLHELVVRREPGVHKIVWHEA